MYEKYGFKRPHAKEIAEFIEESIRIWPDDRKSAEELLEMEWVAEEKREGGDDVEMGI